VWHFFFATSHVAVRPLPFPFLRGRRSHWLFIAEAMGSFPPVPARSLQGFGSLSFSAYLKLRQAFSAREHYSQFLPYPILRHPLRSFLSPPSSSQKSRLLCRGDDLPFFTNTYCNLIDIPLLFPRNRFIPRNRFLFFYEEAVFFLGFRQTIDNWKGLLSFFPFPPFPRY